MSDRTEMGNSSSTTGVTSIAPFLFEDRSFDHPERYVKLSSPQGGNVHVLGVVMSSSQSAEEAVALVRSTSPQALYIDVAPEVLRILQEDIASGRIGDSMRVAEKSATLRLGMFPGTGALMSIVLRNVVADNEMAHLLGCEMFKPYKSALQVSSTLPSPPRILSYPFSLEYDNVNALDRPNVLGLHLIGNAQWASTDTQAMLCNHQLLLDGDEPKVQFTAELPPAGYFTRAQVNQLQRDFRATLNAFAATATADSCDPEPAFAEKEAAAHAVGDFVAASHLQGAALKCQLQSQAVAYELQACADALGPGSNTVALVDIGTLAALKRNWNEALPPETVLPPATPFQRTLSYSGPTFATGVVGYVGYKVFQRFPRTTGSFALAFFSALSGVAWVGVHSDSLKYGSRVRAALARPRVTAPLTRH